MTARDDAIAAGAEALWNAERFHTATTKEIATLVIDAAVASGAIQWATDTAERDS